MSYIFGQSLGERLFEEGRVFNINTDAIAIGVSTETPVLYLSNPVDSGYTFLLKHIYPETSIPSGKFHIVRLYKNPTVTANGTALSIHNMNSDMQGVVTPAVLAYTLPTVTAYGDLIHIWQFTGTKSSESVEMGFGWSLKPGDSIIFSTADDKGFSLSISVVWGENLR